MSFQVVPVECASTVMIVDCPSRLRLQPGHEHCARVTSIIVSKQADYWHNIGRVMYTKRQRCYPLELEKTTQQLASPFAISPPPHHGHMTATSAFAIEDSESRRGRAGVQILLHVRRLHSLNPCPYDKVIRQKNH